MPPPAQLEHFERVLPGAADRIFKMAEGNTLNRWRNDRSLRTVAILGQVSALVVAVTLIGGGLYLAIIGRSLEGLSLVAGTVAAIVWAFRRASGSPDHRKETR